MFKNLSVQSKSFIILFVIAVVGSAVSMNLAQQTTTKNTADDKLILHPNKTGAQVASATDRFMPPFKPVETADWKTYSDNKYPFSFKYKADWKILPGKEKDGFYVVGIDPGAKYYNMNVYVSPKQFFAIDGLPAIPTTINGLGAENVSNLLYGIKMGQNYYTFENGLSAANLIDDFNSLVRTVQFQ